MTKKLEEVFDLPSIKDEEEEKKLPTKEEAEQRSVEIFQALSTAEKVDHALAAVVGLNEHDREMDEISEEALEAYTEIKELAMNMTDIHSGKMMDVAARMLETALDARDRKTQRKLKTLELQLRKLRLEKDGTDDSDTGSGNGAEFDRNELLRHLRNPSEE